MGFDHILRSSASSLKNSGNFPNRLCKNSSAEIGFPSALQNDVCIVCCISRSLPSRSFIFTFLGHSQGLLLQLGQGSEGVFSHSHGLLPHTVHSRGGSFSHTQGTVSYTHLRAHETRHDL